MFYIQLFIFNSTGMTFFIYDNPILTFFVLALGVSIQGYFLLVKKPRKFSAFLLTWVLVGIFITFHLGLNAAHASIANSEGVSISNDISYMVLGEDGWSVKKFYQAFTTSSYVTLILIVAYAVSIVYEKRN